MKCSPVISTAPFMTRIPGIPSGVSMVSLNSPRHFIGITYELLRRWLSFNLSMAKSRRESGMHPKGFPQLYLFSLRASGIHAESQP